MSLCNGMHVCTDQTSIYTLIRKSGKNFNIGHYTLTFPPVLFILTMLEVIGTIDFYYFVSLSMILTLARGHKVIATQNLLASFARTFPADQDEI